MGKQVKLSHIKRKRKYDTANVKKKINQFFSLKEDSSNCAAFFFLGETFNIWTLVPYQFDEISSCVKLIRKRKIDWNECFYYFVCVSLCSLFIFIFQTRLLHITNKKNKHFNAYFMCFRLNANGKKVPKNIICLKEVSN